MACRSRLHPHLALAVHRQFPTRPWLLPCCYASRIALSGAPLVIRSACSHSPSPRARRSEWLREDAMSLLGRRALLRCTSRQSTSTTTPRLTSMPTGVARDDREWSGRREAPGAVRRSPTGVGFLPPPVGAGTRPGQRWWSVNGGLGGSFGVPCLIGGRLCLRRWCMSLFAGYSRSWCYSGAVSARRSWRSSCCATSCRSCVGR